MKCPKCKKRLKWDDADLGQPSRKSSAFVRVDIYCAACKSLFSGLVIPEVFFECDTKTGKPVAR